MRSILLCGGRSKRMGQKKQWLPFGGKPLLLHLIETLQTVCDDVVVVVNEEEEQTRIRQLDLPSVRIVQDLFPGQGPLAGLHAGLSGLASEDAAFLVGCDLPFLSIDVLRTLQKELLLHPEAQAVVPTDGEHLYPVCALYRGQVREIAADCLERQENALRRFLARLEVRYIEALRWRDEMPPPFLNMNTPEDYKMACTLWKKEGHRYDE